MWTRGVFAALVAILAISWAAAQDVDSGPPKGEKVPALEVVALSGPQEGKKLDYPAERKDRPTIYVVIPSDKWARPVHKFLSELSKALHAKDENALVVAVW